LGPLGTATISGPIVPALGDYDDGEIGLMIGRGTEVRGQNQPQRRREPGPLQWEASD
jgi:hypothetical protein